jgi:hypothetical protein
MKWEVGCVGEEAGAGIVFDNKDEAFEEYHRRLKRYRMTVHNEDPPDPAGRPWIALADADGFYVSQGVVRNVVPREGYYLVAVGPLITDEPQQWFWQEPVPSAEPGDHIIYNHAAHSLPRKEGLYAILPFKILK